MQAAEAAEAPEAAGVPREEDAVHPVEVKGVVGDPVSRAGPKLSLWVLIFILHCSILMLS